MCPKLNLINKYCLLRLGLHRTGRKVARGARFRAVLSKAHIQVLQSINYIYWWIKP